MYPGLRALEEILRNAVNINIYGRIVLRLAGAVTGCESRKFSPLLNRTIHVLQPLAPRCMRRMTVARQSRTHFLTLAHVHSMPNGRLTGKQDRKLRLVAGIALPRRASALKPSRLRHYMSYRQACSATPG